MMEYETTPRGWNKNKTTQRKQDKQKLTKQSFDGIEFPKIFKPPRDKQNTHKTLGAWGPHLMLMNGLMGVVLFILGAQEEAPHWFFGSAPEEALGMRKQETLTLQEKFP